MSSPNKLYRVSVWFGIVPLVTGLLTFVLWYYTRYEPLQVVGLILITLMWLFCVFASFVYLIVYMVLKFRQKVSREILIARAIIVLTIIIVNFSTAYFCLTIATNILDKCSLVIVNESSSYITEFAIFAPGLYEYEYEIKPEQELIKEFNVKREGALIFHAYQDNEDFSGIIESYVSTGGGSNYHWVLTLKDDRKFEVKRLER